MPRKEKESLQESSKETTSKVNSQSWAKLDREPDFFDKDLAQIVIERVKYQKRSILATLEKENISLPFPEEVTPGDFAKRLEMFRIKFAEVTARHQIALLTDEVKRYETQPGHKSYSEDISRAREGSKNSLCKILGWDKAWLFRPWVKETIIQAQEEGDQTFLQMVGDAIGKHPKHKQPVKANKGFREGLLKVIEAATISLMAVNPNTEEKKVWKVVISAFWKHLQNGDENDPLVSDREYFNKYLRRHIGI